MHSAHEVQLGPKPLALSYAARRRSRAYENGLACLTPNSWASLSPKLVSDFVNQRQPDQLGNGHSYLMWIDAIGTPVGVQQRLMRHADIRTTMNI